MKYPPRNFPAGNLLSVTALAGLLALAGCQPPTETTKGPDATSSIVPVKLVAAAETEIAKSTQQPATVHPYYETEIRSRVSGYVAEITADIGDVVQSGDSLARVDVPELVQQREILAAEIELLMAEEQGAEAGVRLAEAAVKSASAKVEQAKSQKASVEASLAAAEAEFKRTEDLVNRGSLQNRMLDEVRNKRDSQVAAKEAVLSTVLAAEAEVAVAEAEQAAAEARLKTARSKTKVTRKRLDELEVSLRFAQIVAPFDGVITQRLVNLGDLINGRIDDASSPLFRLSKVDRVRVHVPVPEVEAPFVQPGDSITLTFPSFASEPPITATVSRRTGSLDPSTRTMIVEAELDNASGKLLPGMFGQANIELETKVAMTLLPSRAVRFDESGRAYVYVVDQDNRVARVEVTAGMDTGTEIEILSGIEPGDRVIGPHLKRFSEGQQVQPL